jgi:hypothetical protein
MPLMTAEAALDQAGRNASPKRAQTRCLAVEAPLRSTGRLRRVSMSGTSDARAELLSNIPDIPSEATHTTTTRVDLYQREPVKHERRTIHMWYDRPVDAHQAYTRSARLW